MLSSTGENELLIRDSYAINVINQKELAVEQVGNGEELEIFAIAPAIIYKVSDCSSEHEEILVGALC